MQEITPDPTLIEAFHLMFDHYPRPAQLTHKSRRIVALNAACKAIGREVGMVCATHGAPELHKGCLAAAAVKEGKPRWARMGANHENPGYLAYWLPVDGHPDYYIHFSAGDPE